jgi:tRNA pseudouridine55 synthase
VDKPSGWTSHDVVQRIRRLYQTPRVGHTGTLDPGATGVLPVLLGPATRFAEFLTHLDKTYRVVARFGVTTETQDLEGRVLATSDAQPEEAAVLEALHSFLGPSMQLPPMYSAVRVGGRRLHELAREGQSIERPMRRIVVDSLEDVRYEYPLLSFRIRVSSGTYVRTICHDLGQRLGCGAAVAELRRLVAGPFRVDGSVRLEDLDRQSVQERVEAVVSLEEVFAFLPAVRVRSGRESHVGNGRQLVPGDYESSEALAEGSKVCILSSGAKMLAIGECRQLGGRAVIAPVRVVSDPQADSDRSRRVADFAALQMDRQELSQEGS